MYLLARAYVCACITLSPGSDSYTTHPPTHPHTPRAKFVKSAQEENSWLDEQLSEANRAAERAQAKTREREREITTLRERISRSQDEKKREHETSLRKSSQMQEERQQVESLRNKVEELREKNTQLTFTLSDKDRKIAAGQKRVAELQDELRKVTQHELKSQVCVCVCLCVCVCSTWAWAGCVVCVGSCGCELAVMRGCYA